MATSRQHHFVQAKYLDGFLEPGEERLWCHARGRREPYPAISRKLARKRDFYQLPNSTADQNLENYLGLIEVPGLEALRELVTNRQPLTMEKRIHLARYVAYQEMRVPYSREVMREQNRRSLTEYLEILDQNGVERAEVQGGPLVNGRLLVGSQPYKIARAEIVEALADIDANPETFDLEHMVHLADKMTTFYSFMRWDVLYAPTGSSFITSDCPVVRMFSKPGGYDAFLRKDCSVCFPLNSRAFLIIKHDMNVLLKLVKETLDNCGRTPPPTEFRRISRKGVGTFNLQTAEYAHVWCYSGSKLGWISPVMQCPTKRQRPEFIKSGNLTGMQWLRPH